MISQILDDLFISGRLEALNKELLDQQGITHIVNCCSWGIPSPFKDKTYFCLNLGTITQTLNTTQMRNLTRLLNTARENKGKILFHCFEGKERAPSVLIAYLCETGVSYSDAYNLVTEKRPEAQPTPEMMSPYLKKEVFG